METNHKCFLCDSDPEQIKKFHLYRMNYALTSYDTNDVKNTFTGVIFNIHVALYNKDKHIVMVSFWNRSTGEEEDHPVCNYCNMQIELGMKKKEIL